VHSVTCYAVETRRFSSTTPCALCCLWKGANERLLTPSPHPVRTHVNNEANDEWNSAWLCCSKELVGDPAIRVELCCACQWRWWGSSGARVDIWGNKALLIGQTVLYTVSPLGSGLDDRGSIPGRGWDLYLSPPRPDSSVGIVLGYGLDDRGSRARFPAGAGNFSLHHRFQNGSGAHPASYPMSTRDSFPGVKRQGREADHSPPSSAEVKNAWSYISISPIRLHGVVFS
jgi:hypothetical protein